jgi:hypothetical protein
MGSLEEVVMPQNVIYFEGLTALAEAFSHNPNLRYRYLLSFLMYVVQPVLCIRIRKDP